MPRRIATIYRRFKPLNHVAEILTAKIRPTIASALSCRSAVDMPHALRQPFINHSLPSGGHEFLPRPSQRRTKRPTNAGQERRQGQADPDCRAGRSAAGRRRAVVHRHPAALLGMEKHEEHAAEAAKPVPPSYIDLPEMVANLNSNAHKPSYVKLAARVEVPKPEDAEKVKAAMPRLQDMMQTYLREMRPEELRGSAGTYRLREELLVRANAAVAPAKVSDVLFTQMLIQ